MALPTMAAAAAAAASTNAIDYVSLLQPPARILMSIGLCALAERVAMWRVPKKWAPGRNRN